MIKYAVSFLCLSLALGMSGGARAQLAFWNYDDGDNATAIPAECDGVFDEVRGGVFLPTPEEMKMLLAPKKKKDGKGSVGIDMTSLLLGDGKEFGVWDTIHQEGISIEQILEVGKKVFRRNAKRPPVKDGKVLEEVKSAQQKAADENKAALRRQIEEHKRQELENRRSKKQELEQEVRREEAVKEERREEKTAERSIDVRILSRGGNER